MIARLLRALFGEPSHDPEWHATGVRFTTPRDYDQDKAMRGARLARRRTATGHVIPRPKAQRQSNVIAWSKREAK